MGAVIDSLAIDTRLGELQPEFWSAAGETIIMASSALLIGGALGLARGRGRDQTPAGAHVAHPPRGVGRRARPARQTPPPGPRRLSSSSGPCRR